MTAYRRLLPLCIALAFAVIGFGAYVRLSDAGLACPDWPGCYGQLLGVPENAADPARAWKEMIHRYLAGGLGLGIATLCALSWQQRRRLSPTLPTILVGLVAGQALLGMLTVTLRLKPLVVSAHLLGGMGTLTILVWLYLRQHPPIAPDVPPTVRRWATLALAVLVAQIALGAWVSSNQAALACTGFPACNGVWFPAMDFVTAFDLHHPPDSLATGQWSPALTAIHWVHRLGGLLVLLSAGTLAFRLLHVPGWRRSGTLLITILTAQIALGATNVLYGLPLPLAIAHNLAAAVLVAVSCAIAFQLRHPASLSGYRP